MQSLATGLLNAGYKVYKDCDYREHDPLLFEVHHWRYTDSFR